MVRILSRPALCALLLCAALFAQDIASFEKRITVKTLPNGLKVLTLEDHTAPVVNLSVWYRVGSRNEHDGITGSSHLLEHMIR